MHQRAMLVLAIWLLMAGLAALIGFSFQGMTQIMGVLAVLAAIFLLLDKPWRAM
jgi:hypothetical protein